MAVTVSSKTLEATTLVIQSDLDIDRQEFPQRGVRLRREHAHRQAVARVTAVDVQRPAGVCRGRRPARTACSTTVGQGAAPTPATSASSPWPTGTWPPTGRAARRRRSPGAGRQGLRLHRPARLTAPARWSTSAAASAAPPTTATWSSRARSSRSRSSTAATGWSARNRSSWAISALSTSTSPCRPTSPQGQYRVLVHDEDGTELRRARSMVQEYRPGADPPGGRYAADGSITAARRSRARFGRPSTTAHRWPAARSATSWPTSGSTPPPATRRARSTSSSPRGNSAKRRSCRWWSRCPSGTSPPRSTSCWPPAASRSA